MIRNAISPCFTSAYRYLSQELAYAPEKIIRVHAVDGISIETAPGALRQHLYQKSSPECAALQNGLEWLIEDLLILPDQFFDIFQSITYASTSSGL
jgi:hypothetical protein